MKYISFLLLSVCLLFAFTSCEKNEASQSEIDDALINVYWNTHKDNALFTGKTLKSLSEGVYYVITKEGISQTTEHPIADTENGIYSTVTVDYSGSLLNGTEFDSNDSTELYLGTTIKGWQIGMPLLKCGDKATFFIPSSAAYGDKKQSDIPSNSVLVFDVTLRRFETYHN